MTHRVLTRCTCQLCTVCGFDFEICKSRSRHAEVLLLSLQGLYPGEIITSINGVATDRMSIKQAACLFRGLAGRGKVYVTKNSQLAVPGLVSQAEKQISVVTDQEAHKLEPLAPKSDTILQNNELHARCKYTAHSLGRNSSDE